MSLGFLLQILNQGHGDMASPVGGEMRHDGSTTRHHGSMRHHGSISSRLESMGVTFITCPKGSCPPPSQRPGIFTQTSSPADAGADVGDLSADTGLAAAPEVWATYVEVRGW